MICGLFLTTGCSPSEPDIKILAPVEALFCDVEEPRRFSQEELDWRSSNAPWNLRRDFKTNTAWEREECAVPLGGASPREGDEG
jgi:hypothetical protein